jgi:uncharacterized protein YlbG (UPF0298 family)
MNKKFNFNENYFENIDSEEKAYFLGFISADGYVQDYGYRHSLIITIHKKDQEILEKFKSLIKFNGDIKYHTKRENICQITCTSKKITTDLSKLIVIKDKSHFLNFPDIPSHLEKHFMRGYFDGDGCISIHHDKRDESNRGQVNIVSGSLDFIAIYVNKLIEYADVKKNSIRCPKGSYYIIDWGGLTDVENIYNFLYTDSTIYLKRKKEIFDKVMNVNSKIKKYRKK